MKLTAQDFLELTSRLQMDLRDAQAKLTELRAWIASLDLPTESSPFSEDKALDFVKRVGFMYTDMSLADELALMGADRQFIDKALMEAAEKRRLMRLGEEAPRLGEEAPRLGEEAPAKS